MSRKIALLIGVSEYGEGIPSLSAPLNDVAAMKRVLENPELGGFEVETLRDPEPTPMRKAIKKLFSSGGKEDVVLLFFSGHGITDDENKLYLATRITAKDDFDATAVPASFVQQQSKNSYTKRQVIVLDCCYSGAFAEGWQAKSVGVDLKKELGAEGRVVLTSSTATQTSFQQEDAELSLYTQYLLEGIETGAADQDEDGKIHAHELHQYAKAKVKEMKPKQEPGIIIDREGFNILLSQAPVNDPELDFRKLVEEYATEGQITVLGDYILRVKRQDLGITEEKSDEIVNEVLAPYSKRLENIEVYKKALRKVVEQNYPLTERQLNHLKDLEDLLGLEAQDLAQVKEQILAKKEAEYQRQQEVQQQEQEEDENQLQQYKQEFSRVIQKESPLDEYVRNELKSFQQSLGLRDEDVEQIEQPLIVLKESEDQQRLEAERLKRQEEERLRQQQQENIPSQPQPGQAGILSSEKARRSVLLGSTVLGLALISSAFLLKPTPSPAPPDTAPTPAPDSQFLPVQSSQQPTITTPSKPTLISATTGVDYGRLQKLLEAGKWEEADQETTWAMLQAAGREKESWLRTIDIDNFSCEDLRIIDQLWLEFSKGKFGFSVQKDIYRNLGGTRSLNERGLNFGERVGWSGALDYYDLTFNLNAPKGQLPSVAGWSGIGGAWLENGYVDRGAYGYVFSLAQRLETCSATR